MEQEAAQFDLAISQRAQARRRTTDAVVPDLVFTPSLNGIGGVNTRINMTSPIIQNPALQVLSPGWSNGSGSAVATSVLARAQQQVWGLL